MSRRKGQRRPDGRGRFQPTVGDVLETRTLLASSVTTFVSPFLGGLKQAAVAGKNTTSAILDTMQSSLRKQMLNGPYAALRSGTVNADGFVTLVQELEGSFEQSVNRQLGARFSSVAQMLKFQGLRVVAGETAANRVYSVGLISRAQLLNQARATIQGLTQGPIKPLGTTVDGAAALTRRFESELRRLQTSLGSNSGVTLTPQQVALTMKAEAEAYRTTIHAGLSVLQPYLSSQVDTIVTQVQGAADFIATEDATAAQTDLGLVILGVDSALLDKDGLFGPSGPVNFGIKNRISYPPLARPVTAETALSEVSGQSSIGGTPVLTATLRSTFTGRGIADAVLSFTIDGAFAGVATTDSNGFAVLNATLTTPNAGTKTGAVVVTYAGGERTQSSRASGNLTVANNATTLFNVFGTGVVGGNASYSATLTSSLSGQPISGATVNFVVNGAAVGTATTNASGVATLANVPNSNSPGTYPMTASFAGQGTNSPSTASGSLLVGATTSSVTNVSAASTFGGTATYKATLTSSPGGLPIVGATVSFLLGTTTVGSATTDANGVATLANVTTTNAAGSYAITASFAGQTNFAAARGTGFLTVSQAGTTISLASATSNFGGPATYVASLGSNVTSLAIQGATLIFSRNGASLGTATTNASGVATLSNVTTTDNAGTYPFTVDFAGQQNYVASNGGGNLVVSPAGTSLSAVSGTGTTTNVTLLATLTSAVTKQGISGESVSFQIDGTQVGSATTAGTGIATLAYAPPTPLTVGNHTILASYSGSPSPSTNYTAATSVQGTLVVTAG